MRGLWAALALVATATQADITVDVATAKRLALVMLADGRAAPAHNVLSALAPHHPKDAEILISLSRAERIMGNSAEAIAYARRGFAASQSPDLRFVAARVLAEALASDGKRTRAQMWLRRAGQLAPNDRAEAAVRQDYSYVRSRNPWAFRLGGSITPTDNANDAPTTNEIVIGGLTYIDTTALPVPGIEYTLSATAIYRLPASEARTSQISLSYDVLRTDLGDDAARIDPSLRNADFSADRITLGWSGRFRRAETAGLFDVSARLFTDWNGGSRSQNGLTWAGGHSWLLGTQARLRLGGEVERLARLDNDLRSSTRVTASVEWSYAMGNSDRLGVLVSYSDVAADSFAVAHQSARMRLSYDLARPMMGATLGFSADLKDATFDEPLYGADAREDFGLTLSAQATFTEISAFGFAPTLELTHRSNGSNIARFDNEATQLRLSVRSVY